MARRVSVRRVRKHLVYEVTELADVLSKHPQTITRWINSGELIAETSKKPWIIRGEDVLAFAGVRNTKSETKMALHHIYCLACRGPREPYGRMADFRMLTDATGQLSALCPDCNSMIFKVVKRADLEAIRAKLDVTLQQAEPTLVSCDTPRSNVTYTEEPETHGKMQG